jgi:hypothetical protein
LTCINDLPLGIFQKKKYPRELVITDISDNITTTPEIGSLLYPLITCPERLIFVDGCMIDLFSSQVNIKNKNIKTVINFHINIFQSLTIY